MPSINSGLSIYPSGYDLNAPSGSTMFYVYDEVRDPFTGAIISSGSEIVGVHVNTSYTAINNIERILGLNPQGAFDTVADRIYATETVSGSQAFVKKVGDTMTGNLLIASGAYISTMQIVSPSGFAWSGAGAYGLTNEGQVTITSSANVIYASGSNTIDTGDTLTIRAGSGLGNVLVITSGNIVAYQTISPSGLINIGQLGNPIDKIYVNELVDGGGSPAIPSGVYLELAGGTMSGNAVFSGASILTAISGENTVGTLAAPFSGVYAKTGYFTNISGMSPVTVLSPLVVSSGISPSVSGQSALGTSDFTFGSIFSDSIVATSLVISGLSFDPSSLVQSSGGSVAGNLALQSGATIVNEVSGVNDLGSENYPFANVWAKSINGKASVRMKFNEALNYVSSGVYTFASSPSGATVVDVATIAGVAGVTRFLVPNTDYTISGTTLETTPTFFVSGSLYSPFYIY